MLVALSVIVLMCPSWDKGTWETVLFIHTKVYGQSGPSSANNREILGCLLQSVESGLMGVSPHSSQAKDSFTPGIGIWCYQHEGHTLLGLLCLSQAPAWERVTSCAGMIANPGIMSPLDRSQVNPTWLLWMLPTDGCLWKAVRTCSW